MFKKIIYIFWFLCVFVQVNAQVEKVGKIEKELDFVSFDVLRTYEKIDSIYFVKDFYLKSTLLQEEFCTLTKPTKRNSDKLLKIKFDKIYYENGFIRFHFLLNNKGDIHGISKYFDVFGFKTDEKIYKDGVLFRARSFYPNGGSLYSETIVSGVIEKSISFFYPNGSFKSKIRTYDNYKNDINPDVFYIDFKSKNGEDLVSEGNGFYADFDSLNSSFETGKIKNYRKDSTWTGTLLNGKYKWFENNSVLND